jgi:AbiU2
MTAPQGQQDHLLQRWREQLAKIREHIIRGFLYQVVWTELREEIQGRRPTADGTFLVSYSAGYVAGQMLLVRRLADKDPRSDSLVSLIKRIARNAGVLTRTWYVERWVAESDDAWHRKLAESAWHSQFADPDDPEQLNPSVLQADVDRLATELEHITTWATKTIAHLDPRQPERVPTYGEVREALDVLAAVTRRYESLLNQSITDDWVPIIQGDWQAPFRPSLFPLDRDVYRHPPLEGFT